jgi:hypothetical protein
MIWTSENLDRAVALVREHGNAGDAAAELGLRKGTLCEALRVHRKPVSAILAGKSTEDVISRLGKNLAAAKTAAKGDKFKARYLFERNDEAEVFIVVGDVHVPYQDPAACAAVGDLMRDLRPDGLVINGDYLDLLEVSRHSSGAVAQLEGLRIAKSFDAGNEQLDRWLKAGGPQMRKNAFVDGNHEHRLDRWMASGDNSVWLDDPSTDIGARLRFRERGFVHHKGYPKASAKLGHLLVTHGRWTNKYAAATHMERYGHAILVNHVHAPGMHYGSALGKQKAGFVNGHLADPDSPAMSYAPVPNSWCQGFAVVVVEPNKTFHCDLVRFADGAFYYAGRRYGRKGRK